MIDWDRILELQAEVGEDGVAEVLEIFLEEMDEGLTELSQMTAPDEIADKLHFLKGSAQNIGLDQTSTLCQMFETDIKTNPALRPDVPALQESLEAARGELMQIGS